MTTTALQINPGVNFEATPVLNQAGFSASNLVRWRAGLVEKLGGWTGFSGTAPLGSASPIFCLKAWEGLQSDKYLASGTATSVTVTIGGTTTQLAPFVHTGNLTSPVSATSGSTTVTITDTGSNAVIGDTINVTVPILSTAFGNIYGIYTITAVPDANHYSIVLPAAASATVTSAGVGPTFTTTSGSNSISVAYNAHGFSVGQAYYLNTPTTVGGLTLSGIYTIATVPNANTFTFLTIANATSSASASQNGGQVQILLYPVATPGRTLPGAAVTVTDWTFDNFGAQLVACSPNGPIYVWDPYGSTGTRLTVIQNAPQASDGIMVSPASQMIIAWGTSYSGTTGDPMLIRWCDASNYNSWTPTVTNLAGSLRVPTGSRIVAMTNSSNGILVFTDVDCYLMTFIGTPLVYGINQISRNCGLQSRHAAAQLGSSTFWSSGTNFFSFSTSNGVAPIPCPVWDAVYQNLYSSTSPIVAATNTAFNEIAFYYPSATSGGLNDSYVKLKVSEDLWDYGLLARSAWVDSTSLGGPIGGDNGGVLWLHETAPDGGGSIIAPSITTGFFAIQDGTYEAVVDKIYPDFKFANYSSNTSATILMYLLAQDYADGPVRTYGPYVVNKNTSWIDCRVRARLMALKFTSNELGTWWRLGNIRYRFAPAGRR